jgi:hypothetical protein
MIAHGNTFVPPCYIKLCCAVQTLEELLSLRRQVDTLKTSHEEAQQQAELLKEETTGETGDGWGGVLRMGSSQLVTEGFDVLNSV